MKRATFFAGYLACRQEISIHALVKRATNITVSVELYSCHFNPRPREEGDEPALRERLPARNFNPRPREEGDACDLSYVHCDSVISIHALVKRATCPNCGAKMDKEISIHALVKRATIVAVRDYIVQNISIHALVKRATKIPCKTSLFICHFNPRPREEGDLPPNNSLCSLPPFQSTPS